MPCIIPLGGIVSPMMVGRVRDLTGSTTPALYVTGTMSPVCALNRPHGYWTACPFRVICTAFADA